MARPIIVDGANVAWEEQTADGKPRVANIVAARRELEEAGYEPTILVDATLRHDIDDPDQLEALFDNKAVHQAPAGRAADGFVLQLADEQACPFVSNDMFQPYRDRYPWIEDRRRPYMIIDGRFYLGRRPPDGEKDG